MQLFYIILHMFLTIIYFTLHIYIIQYEIRIIWKESAVENMWLKEEWSQVGKFGSDIIKNFILTQVT